MGEGQFENTYGISVDNDGNVYVVNIANNHFEKFSSGSVVTPAIPLPGMTSPPTDPDSDGLYEDTNGNGRIDFADVVLYYDSTDWIAANEPVAAFDFGGNGRIDFSHVISLYDGI